MQGRVSGRKVEFVINPTRVFYQKYLKMGISFDIFKERNFIKLPS
jgi:hypothetical protein